MELTAELFGQIINQLKGSSGDIKDKRNGPRVGLRNQVHLTPLNITGDRTAEEALVRVRNLSHQGIGIVHSKPMPVGSHFAIRLRPHNRPDVRVTYVVRNCTALGPGLYGIGASLYRVSDVGTPPKPMAAAG